MVLAIRTLGAFGEIFMRFETVDGIVGQLVETGLPAELHAEADGQPPHCFLALAGANIERIGQVAECALFAARQNDAPGVFVVGQPPDGE